MPYPWANALLLMLLALELATGLLGLTSGSSDRAVYLQVHRVGGFAILALLIWKGHNILRSLGRLVRRRRLDIASVGSVSLLGLLVLSLVLGLAWSHGGRFSFQGFSGLSWHIYLSVLLAPIVLWHTQAHRWSLRPRFWAERRSFLRLAGLAAAGFLLWRGGDLTADVLSLPGQQRRFTGSYEVGSYTGNAFPTTSWINDDPSPIDGSEWRLRVTGQVEQELNIPYEDVTGYRERMTATLDCTGGWYSTQD